MKILGYRATRCREWKRALNLSNMVYYRVLSLILWGIWRGLTYRPHKKVIKERQRVCFRCPMYDKTYKICGMCGCYTPFKSRVAEHCDAYRDSGGAVGW